MVKVTTLTLTRRHLAFKFWLLAIASFILLAPATQGRRPMLWADGPLCRIYHSSQYMRICFRLAR